MPKVKVEIDKNRLQQVLEPANGGKSIIEYSLPFVAEITIQGTADILFHKWDCASVESKSNAAKGSKAKKTDDLESYVYRNEKSELCLPGEYLRGAIIGAAKYRQDPRSPRKSAQDLIKAAIVSLTQQASLGQKDWDYEDRRRCVIQRSAITRIRPALKAGWRATIQLQNNLPEYVSPSFLNDLIVMAGKLIGVGDFRPTFGRFHIIKFEVMDL